MNIVKSFIKREFFLLLIVFIVFINPFLYGYRFALTLVVFLFFNLNFLLKNIDRNVVYLLFFGLSYEIFSALHPSILNQSPIVVLTNAILPSILYLTGKYISCSYLSNQIRLFFIFFISFSFSIIPLISILDQILKNGFTEGTRSMYLIWDSSTELNATGLAGYFVLNMPFIGLINIKKNTVIEKRIYYASIVMFMLSLVCVLRLGSRTQLGIALASLIISYILNFKKQSVKNNIIIISVLIIALGVVVYNLDKLSEFFKFYQDRLNDDSVGINTLGGRTERWFGALSSIVTDPFGWDLNRFGYAHNLWLDVARAAGVIPMVFLVFYTISSIKLFLKSIKILRNDVFIKTVVIIIFCSFILQFSVEPIIDGMFLMFLLFCAFVGLLSGIIKNKKAEYIYHNNRRRVTSYS
ncbi:hypothetical protein FO440_02465 [Mucilaginibacter corticis]|uniref:O-antigen ligase family protein n=1 Tax=Mucilaginibacter corticis TaxID=2597670 RepID=A0A556MT17_9SPHI|nr:hypothetical protein [Mucilaginibacter corticis]TSJ43074.1 hypothetical protein FO440_02465 [Mucilaginibacter corticis]